MKEKLEQLKISAINEISKINDSKSIEELEIKYFGKKSELSDILKSMSTLSDDEKREIGPIVNSVKLELSSLIETKKNDIANLELTSKLKEEYIDPTIDLKNEKIGHLHPTTQLKYKLEDIFKSMGFVVYDGPQIETDFFNFEALNLPKNHPARDMQDTFYVKSDVVLRTHTSNCQVRALKDFGVPLKIVIPGRVFRNEALDATHEHTLHQIECVVVDKNISIANLISTVDGFVKKIFGDDVKIRLRPGYFPFVEPGFELDISCLVCGGKKCPACKHTGWLELGGTGMIHPNVLKAADIDSNEYSGFAFGFGLDRMTMQKYKIEDIRWFMGGDLRFINQF